MRLLSCPLIPDPMHNLLCTHDLTSVSDAALSYALPLADRAGARVKMLHVLRAGSLEAEHAELRSRIQKAVDKVGGSEVVSIKLVEGHFMQAISDESSKGYKLAVVGTHGSRGLRQNLFGADILKLVRSMQIPVLVVQEGTDCGAGIERIVMPVAAHAEIDELLDAVCYLASLYAAEVHIYQLIRPNEAPSKELLANKQHMLDRLRTEGIRHIEANEPSDTFSVGFAGPTALYAQRVKAGCIAIMSHASDDYRYIADAEKERMLTNEARIPVLCV